jgi:hypothetical protein
MKFKGENTVREQPRRKDKMKEIIIKKQEIALYDFQSKVSNELFGCCPTEYPE